MFDLKDSAVYTPSWRLGAGLLGGFAALVALPAVVCFLLG